MLKSGTHVIKSKGSSSPAPQYVHLPKSQSSQDYLTHIPARWGWRSAEGLQLEESTVLHHFPFYRAKILPSNSYLCTCKAVRNSDASYTNRNPLISITVIHKLTQQRGRSTSMHKIKANTKETNFFLPQVFMPFFASNDWRLWEGGN